MEDQFKAYWITLPEEEKKVCFASVIFSKFSLIALCLSVVETGGNCAGTPKLRQCSTYWNKLTDIAPPPEESS
jgi:hypothetical protein